MKEEFSGLLHRLRSGGVYGRDAPTLNEAADRIEALDTRIQHLEVENLALKVKGAEYRDDIDKYEAALREIARDSWDTPEPRSAMIASRALEGKKHEY